MLGRLWKKTTPRSSDEQPRPPRRRIALRTMLLASGVTLFTLGIFVVGAIPYQRQLLVQSMESKAEVLATSVSQVTVTSIVTEDYTAVIEHCAEVVKERPTVLYLVIVKKDGFALIITRDGWRQEPLSGFWTPTEKSSRGMLIKDPFGKEQVYHYQCPVEYSGINWGWMHIALSLDAFSSGVRMIYLRTALLAGFCLACGIIVSFAFARRLSRPLLLLEDFTRRVAAGDLSARVSVSSGDEVESLAESFNRMVSSLHVITASRDALNQEIAERKQAEEFLRRSEQRLRTIIETTRDGFWISDIEGRFLDVNEAYCRMSGYARKELLSMKSADVEAQETAGQTALHIRKMIETGNDLYETRHRTKDGRIVDLEISVGYQPLEGGRLFSFARDVTERRNLQQQVLQSQKLEAIGRLASGIAHEINTPTQYIGDNVRFLQSSLPDLVGLLQEVKARLTAGEITPENRTSFLDRLREADADYVMSEIPKAIEQSLQGITHVAKIVRAMKDFSHPSTQKKVPVSINRVLETTMAISRNEWKYVADVVTDLEPSLPMVPGLPGELNQMFLNLLVNAAQAIEDAVGKDSGRKGTITVTTRSEEEWVEARISDTGNGIPASIRENIFDPFFTTKDVGRGTGQGLSIARSVVVERHGGTLTFETEEGKGTTFIIRLPRSEAAATKENT